MSMGIFANIGALFSGKNNRDNQENISQDDEFVLKNRLDGLIEDQLNKEAGEDYDKIREMREQARISARLKELDEIKNISLEEQQLRNDLKKEEHQYREIEEYGQETSEEREARLLTEKLTREGTRKARQSGRL